MTRRSLPTAGGGLWLFERDRSPLYVPNIAQGALATLPPLVRLPLQLWMHAGANLAAARDHVANLNLILNGLNPAGIVFDLTAVATPGAAVWERIGHNCRNEHEIRASRWYRPGVLNAYYHAEAGVSARCCLAGDMVFLPPGAALGLLAHEAGHALGLRGDGDGSQDRYDDGHTESLPAPNPFTSANLMWRGEATAAHGLTLGQIVWMHAGPQSIARRNGVDNPLPCWRDDDRDRAAPEDGSADILRRRYRQIVRYWDEGRRPEGRLGSKSEDEFVRLHLR
ncbi:MAG: hypothetical protein R2748_28425 [Bryobacterales bacterium]